MHRCNILAASVIAALGLALPAGDAAALSAKDLAGTWTLVSADAFGPAPKGTFIFDANGHFSTILLNASLPKYASNNRVQGTPAEYKATVDGSLAFFGTYSVNGTDLVLHMEGSTFPNWIGTDQKRINISVTGDEFKYTQAAPSGGGPPAAVVWKRTK